VKYTVRSYYLHNLSPREQQAYVRMVESIKLHRPETVVSDLHLTQEESYRAYCSLWLDHPEIIWLGHHTKRWTQDVRGADGRMRTEVVKVGLEYTLTQAQVKAQMAEIQRAAAVLIRELEGRRRSPWEKVLWLHNALIHGIDYDEKERTDHRVRMDNHSIYGVLVKRTAVCEGYAEAMTYLLRQVGVDCITCLGAKGWASNTMPPQGREFHAWNCVTIDGRSMQLDVTWDDMGNSKKERGITYRYFGLTQREMERVHGHGSYLPIPTCQSPGLNYFVHQDLIAGDLKAVIRMVRQAIDRRESFLEFRVKNPALLRRLGEKDRWDNPVWYPRNYRALRSYATYEPDERIGWYRIEFNYR
jgi:hypothetical protein